MDLSTFNVWNLRTCNPVLYCIYFQYTTGRINLGGVKYDLMLPLRSQIFEYLRETFNRHAQGSRVPVIGSLRKKKEKKESYFTTEAPDQYWLFEGLWSVGVGTRSRLRHRYGTAAASILGPEQKKWLCHPLPLFMAVRIIICDVRAACGLRGGHN